jgi:hypothetical protein
MEQIKTRPPIDVLFISSSLTWDAIIPSEFSAQVKAQSGKQLSAYNAGMPLLDAGTSQIALDEKVIPLQGGPPKYLVYGVSFAEMAQNGWHDTAINAVRSLTTQPTANAPITSRVMYWFYQNVYILRYRTSLQIPFRVANSTGEDTDADGFHRTTHVFDVTTYLADASTRVSYALNDDQFNQLDLLAKYCKEKNIQLILLDLPHHPALFQRDNIPASLVNDYQSRLSAFAQDHEVPLLLLSKDRMAWMEDPHYFYDQLHVNTLGAQQITAAFSKFFAESIR